MQHGPAAPRRFRRGGRGTCVAAAQRRPARHRLPRAGPCRGKLERDHGPLAAEEVMDAVGRLVEAQLQPGDLGGRVAARGIGLLFERGNARDQEAWLARMLRTNRGANRLPRGNEQVTSPAAWAQTPLAAHGDAVAKPLAHGYRGAACAPPPPAAIARCIATQPARKPQIDEAGSSLGRADQVGADGEPLPPRAAADREPGRRRPARCSTWSCACSTRRARRCCRRNSSRPPSAPTS